MLYLITAALVVALVVLLRRHWAHRRAMRSLHQAILQKQPLLREDLPGALSESWDQLCRETNELISEVTRLQHQRTGQLAQLGRRLAASRRRS
jgi:two-component system phosphate regulon sensor histidine kinase PhoR